MYLFFNVSTALRMFAWGKCMQNLYKGDFNLDKSSQALVKDKYLQLILLQHCKTDDLDTVSMLEIPFLITLL